MYWKFLLGLCLFIQTSAIAQQGTLTFHTESYNFGRISKPETVLRYDFVFQNTGTKAVNIVGVESDCACITSSFPTSSLAPNEESIISIAFSPYRAGPFEKEFIVLTDATPKTYALKVKGYILPYIAEHTAKDFVYQKGSLRFRNKNLNLGTITTQITVTKKMYFYNSTAKAITFTDKIIAPDHIKVFFDSSMTVQAGQIGAIVVTYDPKQKNSFGYLQDQIHLSTTQKEKITLTVAADIQPDTHISIDETEDMPSICINNVEKDIINQPSHKDVVTEVELRNEGNVALKIHKIAAAAGCEILSDNIDHIAPKTSTKIKVRLMNNGKAGFQDTFLTIYSNDPYKSKQVVAVKTHVYDK